MYFEIYCPLTAAEKQEEEMKVTKNPPLEGEPSVQTTANNVTSLKLEHDSAKQEAQQRSIYVKVDRLRDGMCFVSTTA